MPAVCAIATPTIIVCIQSDPMETHRPVEGLRIALGLSTGFPALTVILLGRARLLLTEEACDVIDADVLERHLPAVRELRLDLVIPEGSGDDFSLSGEFAVREVPQAGIATLLLRADHSLVF